MMNEIVKRLAQPLFDEGATVVYAVECCDKVFVGKFPPTKCRACGMPVRPTAYSALDKG